jgi:hypothetical protein
LKLELGDLSWLEDSTLLPNYLSEALSSSEEHLNFHIQHKKHSAPPLKK